MATISVSTLLKCRDAAQTIALKFVSRRERFDLQDCKFLGSDFLFSHEKVFDANVLKGNSQVCGVRPGCQTLGYSCEAS